MPFLNPLVFATGAIAASAPIIIHLLNRRRFRIRDWAAMRFLLESLRKNRKRLRIEEIILLAIRTLIVLLLAVALARFTGFGQSLLNLGGEQSRTIVFVLDDSYSMGQVHADATLFDQAKQDLIEEIRKLGKTDRVAVILTSRPGAKAFFGPQELTNPESLIADLEGRQLSDLRTDLAEPLAMAGNILADEENRKDLMVFSDFRTADLADKGHSQQLRRSLDQIREKDVGVSFRDYGLEPEKNLSVEWLTMTDRYVSVGDSADFEVAIRNNGPNTADNVKVVLKAIRLRGQGLQESDLPVQQLEAAIPPGETVRKAISYQFREKGPMVLSASVVADDLAGDNAAYLAVDVVEAVRVLIVDGGNPGEGAYGASSYLAYAMDPPDYDTGYKVTTRYFAEMDSVDFADYDMVFLLDVADMPQRRDDAGEPTWPKLRELEDFVRDGGGLVIFTGNRLSLSFYNGPFYAEGGGLLPYKIASPREATGSFRIDSESIRVHPIWANTFGIGEAGKVWATLIRILQITPAELSAPRPAAGQNQPLVLASVKDKADTGKDPLPFAAEQAFGKGRVLMFYTTANTAWNDWPKEEAGSFPTTMLDLGPHMARTRKADFTARLPAPVELELSGRGATGVDATLVLHPAGDMGTTKARRRYQTVITSLKDLVETTSGEMETRLSEATAELDRLVTAASTPVSDSQAAALAAAGRTVLGLVEKLDKTVASERVAMMLADDPRNLMKFELQWDRIRSAGLYSLDMKLSDEVRREARLPENLMIVRNVDPEEGRISVAGRQRVEDVLGPVDSYLVRVRKESGTAVAPSSDSDADWWKWAMGALAVLLAMETFLGLKFGHYARATRRD